VARDVKLPELGENIEEAEVISVLVEPGQTVSEGQPLLELETDKATVEVPAPFGGVVSAVRVKPGDRIKVGQAIVAFDGAGDGGAAKEERPAPAETPKGKPATKGRAAGSEPRPAAPEPEPEEEAQAEPAETADDEDEAREAAREASEQGAAVSAGPAVRKLARELGIDVAAVRPSKESGRLSLDDVKRHAREQLGAKQRVEAKPSVPELPDFSKFGAVERKALSGMRRTTAATMARSWQQIPHVTQFDRADITELEALRRRLGERAAAASGAKLTLTAIVLKVAASALRAFPKFGASLDIAREEVVYKQYVHIGVAVDTEYGLTVPVIRDVDQKNLLQIAAEVAALSERARHRKLGPEDLAGANFTVTNLGGLGTTYFSPIIHWPEVSVLGVGRAATEAVHGANGFEPRLILPLSVSYDHRLIDGADAARFQRWIAEALEQPFLLAL
jgi:pyruvate dehydrogenase E2 component (dihydrolipoamide acetyltransferase)